MCRHYDRSVKGINLLNVLCRSAEVSFEVILKPIQFCDAKTRQIKRAGMVTKNGLNNPVFMAIRAVFKLECKDKRQGKAAD